jgi:hypothetical protein
VKKADHPLDRRKHDHRVGLDRRKHDDDLAERMVGGIRTWSPSQRDDRPSPKKPQR